MADHEPGVEPQRVVYLLGAGASHACVKAVGSDQGILMSDLADDLGKGVRELVDKDYGGDPVLTSLINEIVDESTDYEHIITFLDQSVSAIHRAFADDLRGVFERVLRDKLDAIEAEQGLPPVGLYEALLDMYELPEFPERLKGVLTINYDEYLERAVEHTFARSVDFGVLVGEEKPAGNALRMIKLHGSFGWEDAWPILRSTTASPLWIPPGIQKAKDRYPFNVLWGMAREMLDCDILRIVGCKLGPNDWDLISLLFSTRHVNRSGRRYQVQVIDAPLHAKNLAEAFPYLDVRSILEVEPLGRQLVSEFGGGKPRPFASLTFEEQDEVREKAGWSHNWFRLWLQQMAEITYTETGNVDTPRGRFKTLLEAY